MTLRFSTAVVAAVAAAALAPPASADVRGLEVVKPDELTLTTADEESAKASLWLSNSGDKEAVPSFSATLEDSDGDPVSPDEAKVELVDDNGDTGGAPSPVPPGGLARYRIMIKGKAVDEASGVLVATAPALAPATVAVSLAAEPTIDPDVDWAIWIPLIATAAILGLSFPGGLKLSAELPAGELDFGKSLASTLTLVGALLGLAISAGVLPAEPAGISKESFVALNLVFGVAIVVAGVVYAALPTRVFSFLVAGAITIFATIGQLWTLWLLVDELGQDSGLTTLLVVVFKIALVVGAVAVFAYIRRRLRAIADTDAATTSAAFPSLTPATGRIPLL